MRLMRTPWLGCLCIPLLAATLNCSGSATCESCSAPALDGLTLLALEQQATGACVPVEILPDGDAFAERTQITLSGGIGWYGSSSCSVRASSVTAEAGAPAAVAFMNARSAGTYDAVGRAGTLGFASSVTVTAPSPGTPAAIRVAGVRHSSTGVCAPLWVQAQSPNGSPVSVAATTELALSGPQGTRFYSDAGCANAVTSVSLQPGASGSALFALYAMPGHGFVSASAPGMTATSLDVRVGGSALRDLAFVSADDVAARAGECVSLSVAVVDPQGTPINGTIESLALTTTEGLVLFGDSGCGFETSSITTDASGSATFFGRATLTGSYIVSVTGSGFSSITQMVNVTAGSASKLTLTARPRMAVGGCYPASVTPTDAFGNAPSDNVTRQVTVTPASGLSAFRDSDCTEPLVTTLVSNAASSFYVQGAEVASGVQLAVSAPVLGNAQRNVAIVAAATKLSVGTTSISAGVCTAVTISALDTANAPADVIAPQNVTLTSSSTSLRTYSDASCGTGATNVRLPALRGTVVVYVISTAPGTYTLSASGGTLTASPAATQTVGPGSPSAITSEASRLINARSCTAIEAGFVDAYGNATAVGTSRLFSFTASGSGAFFRDASCTASARDGVTVTSGTGLTVYYRSNVVETATLTIASTGLTSATMSVESDYFIARVHTDDPARSVYRYVAVDPSNGARIWATFTDGSTWLTSDSGITWARQCDTTAGSPSDSVAIIVSPASDQTAYLINSGGVFRLQTANVEGRCPVLNSGLGFWYPNNSRTTPQLTVDVNGQLYLWHMDNGSNSVLQVSSNRGASWTARFVDTTRQYWSTIAVNPLNTQQIVNTRYFPQSDGPYYSSDGGASFTRTTSTDRPWTGELARFDPAHAGYVYTTSHRSTDSGATWASHGSWGAAWALDASGAVYSLSSTGARTMAVRRAPDARNASFTALASIADIYNASSATLSVSNDGTTIALATGGRAYVSTDAGATFDYLQPPAVRIDAAIVAVSDTVAYAVDSMLGAYATTDGGATWSFEPGFGPGYGSQLVHFNERIPESVYARYEWYSGTYEDHIVSTQDGFATLTEGQGASNWTSIGAVSLTDSKVFYILGSTTYRTLDAGVTRATKSSPITNTFSGGVFGAVSPTDTNVVLFAGLHAGKYGLYRFDYAAGTVTEMTNVGLQAAALEQYWQGGRVMLRAASQTGEMTVSSDFGQTFGGRGPAASGTGTCSRSRLVASATANHDLVATTCAQSDTIAYSTNGGAGWNGTLKARCGAQQLTVVSNGIVVSCAQGVGSTFLPFP